MDKLRNTTVPVVPVVVLAVVAVGLAVYFFYIRPSQAEANAAKNWATPEAAALRGPGRKVPAGYEQTVQNLLNKEGRTAGLQRRRERE